MGSVRGRGSGCLEMSGQKGVGFPDLHCQMRLVQTRCERSRSAHCPENVEAVSYYSGPGACWNVWNGPPGYQLPPSSRPTHLIGLPAALYVTGLAVVGHRVVGLAALGVFVLRSVQDR